MTTTMSPETNTDLTIPAIVESMKVDWHPSPSPTVWRKSLYRQGGEYGPVTSVVRYDANSQFSRHSHPQGEEILVLDGVFSDEQGDYPKGTYILNPAGSSHAPFSKPGCVLFVHLKQYQGDNRLQCATNTNSLNWCASNNPGVQEKVLYQQPGFKERISLERWSRNTRRSLEVQESVTEIFVTEGVIETAKNEYGPRTWLRLPARSGLWEFQSAPGCEIYLRRMR